MEKCQYNDIPKDSERNSKHYKRTDWKPFLKQLLICSGVWTSVFMFGLNVGAPTMFIAQIRRDANSTEVISDDMASWLTAAYSFSGFPFVIIISITTKFIGRKIPVIIATLDLLATFVLLYFSTNVTHILISNIIQGLFSASQIVIIIMILTEYTSPKYRGIFLIVKAATFYWGIWASNVIGTFFHWRNIPLFGIVCAMYTLLNVFIWPESPYWLAMKGRFDECAASHRWLKGCDGDSEKELEALMNSHREYLASSRTTKLSVKEYVFDFFKTIKSKEFYKPTLIANLTGFLSVCSGKLVFAVYAVDVLKKITNNEQTAYTAMLVIDGFTVLSMYGGCILSKVMKRRQLFLSSASVGVTFLFVLSLYLYLISLTVITENSYVTISLFVAFSIAISLGPLTMSISVFGELIPIRSRNLSMCMLALTGKFVSGLSIKLSPSMFKTFGLHGGCLTFGLCSLLTLTLLYKYLPETKDKTLQEIADSINNVKPKKRRTNTNLLLNN